jgi:hypothetical protein
MNKHLDHYPAPKNRASGAVLTLMGTLCLIGVFTLGLLGVSVITGCVAKTAATVNRDITSVIAGAGAAANQAEQEYQNKVIAQTPAARTAINTLGAAYSQARDAFIAVLNAENAYRGAEQLQLIGCSPATVAPANPPAVNCGQTTQNVTNALAKVQATQADLSAKIANLANQTKAVQALK